ncbi:AraC family transcriptional regulator [Miniphocaeibacter halophilus]|uniref:Helix-turn-helix domain-containing protein n=1 Tax=Miniphocaeibacter halophilus TaxID=2931922 RepID=A0AC61MTY4_9FIRM|nr:response regulator transcription factor [Miniphocaeibacter halophilus]QQK07789.1 helix-turn-helix domain-containing protein [Miniphocaeibacter halophilus]
MLQRAPLKSTANKIINDIFVLDLSYEELKNKQVPMELEEKYYSIIIAGIENFVLYINEYTNLELLELDRNFGSQIKEQLEKFEQIYMLQEQLCERIICIYGDSENEVLSIIENLETKIKNLKIENMNGVLFKGSTEKGIFKIKQSYSIARNSWKVAQENYWEISPILTTDGKSENYTFFSYDSSKIKSAIRSGEEEEILNELEKFYKKLGKGYINSYLQWIMIFSNLYREIIQLPEEVGVKVDDIIGNPDLLLKEMMLERKREIMMNNLRAISSEIGNEFKKAGQGRQKDILNKALTFIDDNYYKEDLTIGDVAKNIYVSSSYLSLLFRKELGKTFIEILSDTRMEHAKNLLLNTNLRSYEVGEKCGYSNPSYFSTVFKGYYGCSPSKFKKKS